MWGGFQVSHGHQITFDKKSMIRFILNANVLDSWAKKKSLFQTCRNPNKEWAISICQSNPPLWVCNYHLENRFSCIPVTAGMLRQKTSKHCRGSQVKCGHEVTSVCQGWNFSPCAVDPGQLFALLCSLVGVVACLSQSAHSVTPKNLYLNSPCNGGLLRCGGILPSLLLTEFFMWFYHPMLLMPHCMSPSLLLLK